MSKPQAWHRLSWRDKRSLRRAAVLLGAGTLTREEYNVLVVRLAAQVLGKRIELGSRVDHAEFISALTMALADKPGDAAVDESDEFSGPYGPYSYSVITLASRIGGVRTELVWEAQHDELYARARAKVGRLSGWLLHADAWLSEQRQLFPNLSPALERTIWAVVSFVVGLVVGYLGALARAL